MTAYTTALLIDALAVGSLVAFLATAEKQARVSAVYAGNTRWYALISAFNMPGVYMHEMSHYLVSLVLLGRPGGISLAVDAESGVRGSLTTNGVMQINATAIGYAPLFLIPLGLMSYFLVHTEGWMHGVHLYLIAMMLRNSIPSDQDLDLAAYGGVIGAVVFVLFTSGLVYAAMRFTGMLG